MDEVNSADRPHSTAIGLLSILVIVLLVFGSYFGGYFLLVDRSRNFWVGEPRESTYRLPGPLPHYVFYPANCVDRWLRPNYWVDQKAIEVDLSEFGEPTYPSE
jgi:hypothetical protein